MEVQKGGSVDARCIERVPIHTLSVVLSAAPAKWAHQIWQRSSIEAIIDGILFFSF